MEGEEGSGGSSLVGGMNGAVGGGIAGARAIGGRVGGGRVGAVVGGSAGGLGVGARVGGGGVTTVPNTSSPTPR